MSLCFMCITLYVNVFFHFFILIHKEKYVYSKTLALFEGALKRFSEEYGL